LSAADRTRSTHRPPFVLFDLDGTLADSAPSILGALRLAFAEYGVPPLDPATERSLLGPPFHDTLPPLIAPVDVADLIATYRRHYSTEAAMAQTVAYDGIEGVLRGLVAAGVQLGVATSKAEAMAVPIVHRLGMSGYFTHVTGDLMDGTRGSKALVVAEALRRFGHPAPADVLMVGDRLHDVVGAAAHGVATLGAGWGYGAPGELAAAGAAEIFATPAQLGDYLGVG
jgi:phosphoglycolate phosphatase